jgi:hypothetical protein
MILIPSLNNAVISNGDFLLALTSEDATIPTVCRVVRAVSIDELIVTWWLSREEVSQRQNLQEPPHVSIELYSNVLKCRLKEVLEVRSSSCMIHKNVVQDIAFVFHINDLEYNLPNCAGMSRVFYTRYSYDESNRLIDVDCRNHFPFSTAVLEPYPSRIWYAILEVKHNVEKMLNDPKQYQPCKKMLLVHFSLEAWSYLFVNLVNSGTIVAPYVCNNTKKIMHCDLGLSSRRIKKHLTLVRVDCLNSLVSLFLIPW